MRKLRLFNAGAQKAFEVLGEYAGLYGDNGGNPDGNCWLPSNAGDIPSDIVQRARDFGYGELVEVNMATDEAMYAYFGFVKEFPGQELDEESFDLLRDLANENLEWAHYGAYGAADSHWVFVKPTGKWGTPSGHYGQSGNGGAKGIQK